MAELREALGRPESGFRAVTTYIQSGNIVLDAPGQDEPDVISAVHDVVAERFGLEIPVVARTAGAWPDILSANPFPDAVVEPKRLHVLLCDTVPEVNRLSDFDPSQYEPDRFAAYGRELYVWYDQGAGRSKLTGAVVERALGVTATARNWSTMLKLSDMIDRAT